MTPAHPRTPPQWLTWISGVILSACSAGIGVMIYAYTTFQTVKAAERDVSVLDARLNRIEDKLDRLLESRH